MRYYLTVLRVGFAGFFEWFKSIPVGKYREPDAGVFKNNGVGIPGPDNFYGLGIGTGF